MTGPRVVFRVTYRPKCRLVELIPLRNVVLTKGCDRRRGDNVKDNAKHVKHAPNFRHQHIDGDAEADFVQSRRLVSRVACWVARVEVAAH